MSNGQVETNGRRQQKLISIDQRDGEKGRNTSMVPPQRGNQKIGSKEPVSRRKNAKG